MKNIIKAKAFTIGNGTTAYKIISQARWTACGTEIEELGKWTFEPSIPEIANVPNGFKNMGYEIVVAGTDFGGGGKSNDHPVLTLKGAGVKVLIAESFNRIFFRNALNLGMPAITCPGILQMVKTGDELECRLSDGIIRNLSTGQEIKGLPLCGLPMQLIEAGGLLPYYRKKLSGGK